MSDVIRALTAVEQGDPSAAEQLLPLVYGELRQLAAQRLSREAPGQTLQPTALVHEAYLRLVDHTGARQKWDGRGHFFAAAAEAMRRILVERARRRERIRHGGGRQRVDLDRITSEHAAAAAPVDDGDASADEVLAVDEALNHFAAEEPDAARLVQLRYFAGMTIEQAAEAMNISVRTANRHWAYARAWLYQRLSRDAE